MRASRKVIGWDDWLVTGVLLMGIMTLNADAVDLSQGVSVVEEELLESFEFWGKSEEEQFQIIEVEGQPFEKAMRLCGGASVNRMRDLRVSVNNKIALEHNDVLWLEMYMRAQSLPDGISHGPIAIMFEESSEPWEKSLDFHFDVSQEWTRISVAFKMKRPSPNLRDSGFTPSTLHLSILCGHVPQCIEIGGVRCLSFGRTIQPHELPSMTITYPGMEPSADWRALAQARIEKLRKADFHVSLVDANGAPVAGATVAVSMNRHAFPFGTVVNARYLRSSAGTPEGDRYRETITSLFNCAVLENSLKIPSWFRDRTFAIEAVDWLLEQGIPVRGHVLVWPSWRWSPWRSDEDTIAHLTAHPEELRERVAAHIKDIVTTMRGKLYEWDVVNEPFVEHDFMDILGHEVMVDWFHLARQYDPKSKLFINDYNILSDAGRTDTPHQQHYEDTIRFLLDEGAPLEGIGLQSHFSWKVTPPETLWEILNRYAQFGLPLLVTEFDHAVTNETLQADFLRDFLTMVFSHPAVEGFLMWGFWDTRHWLGNAPIYRQDWSLKPSGQVFLDLVHGEWRTNETLVTDEQGQLQLRGFLGSYTITIEHDGHTETVSFDLTPDHTKLEHQLTSP